MELLYGLIHKMLSNCQKLISKKENIKCVLVELSFIVLELRLIIDNCLQSHKSKGD